VLKADPDCGIAYWGIALSLLNNPHAPPPVGNLPLGLAAIEKGKAIGAKTQRERDFINAMAASIPTSTKSTIAPACSPTSRPWKAWRRLIRMTTKRKFSMRSNSMSRPRRSDKTYAMQLKGAPSSSRSSSANRAIPASPTT
jgi:hypothetical protein